jgi:hypothetical protein
MYAVCLMISQAFREARSWVRKRISNLFTAIPPLWLFQKPGIMLRECVVKLPVSTDSDSLQPYHDNAVLTLRSKSEMR